MQAVCYYRETLDVGVLESALRQTLARYPILAGRLDLSDPDPSRKGIRLTNDGVPFRVVADHTPFDQLPQDYADESRRFLDYEPWIDIMLGGAPVFTAKVTQLSEAPRWACASYAVSDGQGFVEFLVAGGAAAGVITPSATSVRSIVPPRVAAGDGWDEFRTMLVGRDSPRRTHDDARSRRRRRRVLVPDFLRFPPGNRMMVPVPKANLDAIEPRRGRESKRGFSASSGSSRRGDGLEVAAGARHRRLRRGKRGLPDMYFGNASIGMHGTLVGGRARQRQRFPRHQTGDDARADASDKFYVH